MIVDMSTEQLAPPVQPDPYEGKNPAKVNAGRIGGRNGGKARDAKLSDVEKTAIAHKGAIARWKKSHTGG